MTDLLMPKLGLTMTEGLLTEWIVRPGAGFKVGQPLFTVETDKVSQDVMAECDGVLSEILVPAGSTVPVGTPVGRIEDERTLNPEEYARNSAPTPASANLPTRTHPEPDVIREADAHILSFQSPAECAYNRRIAAMDIPTRVTATVEPPEGPRRKAAIQEIEPDAIRLAIARRVSGAKQLIPHFYISSPVIVDGLMKIRAELNSREGHTRISVTHMIVKAVGIALLTMPEVNCIWVQDKIYRFEQADVGIVVDTPEGPRVPVLRGAATETLEAVASAAALLRKRAQNDELTAYDVGNCAISISNVGMFGVANIVPIINPPNSMILGVGAAQHVFRPNAGYQPELRYELSLTLACDHRLIDGVPGARFLSRLREIIEHPERLLLQAHPSAS